MAENNVINTTFPLSPAKGGTGGASLTNHGVLIGQGASAINSIVLSAGQILIGTTSSDPSNATLTNGQNISITSGSGSISVALDRALDNNYSTVSPAISSSSGFGSIVLSRSVNQRIGDTANLGVYYIGNPSATTCSFTITVPFMVGNFPDALQCVGNGTFYRLAGASLSNMGAVLEVVSVSGSKNITVNCLSQATGVSHVISLNIRYKVF